VVWFFRKAERPSRYLSWAAHNRAEPLRAEATRKWHCKPLKSLKMDSGSAARRRCFGFAEVRDEIGSVEAWDRPSRPLRGAHSEVFEISRSGPRKLRKSAVKSLKSLTRVTLCAALAESARRRMVRAPARFGGTGPCFAARETSGMLQMISRLGNAWPPRPGAANVRQRCSERPSALAYGAATDV
jgi:hypothetical protein